MKDILRIKRVLSVLLLILALVTFYACGGGGGGGSDPSAGPITYTGLESQAVIDENNAQEMIAGAFDAANSGMAATEFPASIQPLPSDHKTVLGLYAHRLSDTLAGAVISARATDLSNGTFTSAIETESGTIYGDCGGQASYTFTANDAAGAFDGRMTFLSYCNDGVTISGRTNVQGTFDTVSGDPLTITITFDNLESDYIILNGTISLDLSMIPYVVTMNFYAKDKTTGKVHWIRDYTLEIKENNGEVEVVLTGRFYHPDYGYVMLTTPIPFIIYEGDDFPSSGTLVLTGANGTKAELNTIDHLHCECKWDSDGDGAYEWSSGVMLWSDLHETDGVGSLPPTPGEWSGTAGFGEIEFTVRPNSAGLESIAITFNDFSCGGVISNGTITQTGSWTISNNRFTADIDWSTASANRSMEIIGTFANSGTAASGTYEADYDGTICNGTWDALPGSGDNNGDDHGDGPSSATVLQTNGTKVSGEIQTKPGGDLDYFRFFATAGTTYTIETSDLEGGLDTVIVLYSTNGTTQIDEDDDGADEPLASRIVWACQVSGTYYVSVRPYSENDTGGYNIAVSVGGQTLPVAGDWSGPSGFGEIGLVVASDSTEIESIAITFNDYICGGIISNGTITRTGSWAISNGQFTANLDWTGTLGDRTMEIIGTFDDSGTSVSGTYEADYDGTICDGTWTALPE